MNLQESIRRILKEETDSVKNLNESKTSQHLKLMNNLLEPFKEKDCVCDIRVSFDVEDNYYNIYLVFSQKELHDKFSDLYGIRGYISKMQGEVKMELESFLPIRNTFIGYYTKPNCEWSPLNESKNKKLSLLNHLEKYGLYEFTQETNLSISYFINKVGDLSKKILVNYIKDFIKDQSNSNNIIHTLDPEFDMIIDKHNYIDRITYDKDADVLNFKISDIDRRKHEVNNYETTEDGLTYHNILQITSDIEEYLS